MKYETVVSIDGWNCATDTECIVDVYFTIKVEDGSFSHDWTPGAVEKATDYEIENMHIGFQHKGKAWLFDLDSDAKCIVEWDEHQMEIAKEVAVVEAIDVFENPDGTWEDCF
jgi:hypothetical protein